MLRQIKQISTFTALSVGVLGLLAVPALADTPTPEKSPLLAGYKKGFFLQSPDKKFKLKISGRVQARFAYEGIDGFGDTDDVSGEGTDDEMSFLIPRARLSLKGHAFSKALTYKFQTDFGKGAPSLKDFLVNYKFSKNLQIRVGQWKRPFSRHQINSSGKLQLVDRSFTDKKYDQGRDIGVAIHNGYEKSPTFEWAVGVFNGTSVKPSIATSVIPNGPDEFSAKSKQSNTVDRFKPALVARVGYNLNGIKGYSEGDFKGGGFRLAIGAGAMYLAGYDDETGALRANLDFVMKIKGFALSGAFFVAMDDSADANGDLSLGMSSTALRAQASYLINKKYQPVVGFSMFNPETVSAATPSETAVTGGFSWYFQKHKLKWQTDFTAMITDDGTNSATDMIVRSQLQLAF